MAVEAQPRRNAELPDAEATRSVLTAALGVRGAVEKSRHLFPWKQVRIHLDDVSGLGQFIELEAVAPVDSDLSQEYALVAQLRDAFQITDECLCAAGYATQLEA